MCRLYGSERTVVHALHTTFAGKFPIRPVLNQHDGMSGTLLYAKSAIVAIAVGNKGFGNYKTADEIISQGNWGNQYV